MPELRSYLKQDVPRDIAVQIRSFIRIQWAEVEPERTTIVAPPPVTATVDRTAFVLVEGEVLISHAEANLRSLEHRGQTYRVGGLSAVLTYPAHRGRGNGER